MGNRAQTDIGRRIGHGRKETAIGGQNGGINPRCDRRLQWWVAGGVPLHATILTGAGPAGEALVRCVVCGYAPPPTPPHNVAGQSLVMLDNAGGGNVAGRGARSLCRFLVCSFGHSATPADQHGRQAGNADQ
jgi:hypothetical protein